MYTIEQLSKGVRNPRMAVRMISHDANFFWNLYNPVTRMAFDRNDPRITDQDWDNALLIDACRYDIFEEYNSLPGELEKSYSVASRTSEFVDKTFKNEEFGDIVCVTASPKYYERNVSDSFHHIVQVWKDEWDDNLNTVSPDVMNKYVKEAHRSYPNKQILAHYIQPHIPFIRDTGREIHQDFKFGNVMGNQDIPDPWKRLRHGKINPNLVWEAYCENHELIINTLKKVIPDLDGKTVITSDHGNAFGTMGIYGHPRKRHLKELIEVPWLVCPYETRKQITDDGTNKSPDNIADDIVKERLEDLGYI